MDLVYRSDSCHGCTPGGDDPLPIEDGPPMLPPVPLPTPSAPLKGDMPKAVNINVNHPGVGKVVVSFDNYTHQSGRLRAFSYCKAFVHNCVPGVRCRKDVYVGDFKSRHHAAAFLIAWQAIGQPTWTAEQHIKATPDDVLVDTIARQHFG